MKIRSVVLMFRFQVFFDATMGQSVMGPSTVEDEGNTEFHKFLFITVHRPWITYSTQYMDKHMHISNIIHTKK